MEALHISPPNTCALVISPTNVAYVECTPEQNIFPPTTYTSFEQFVEPMDALLRAREINPDYNANIVLGPLAVAPIGEVPDGVEVTEGSNVTLEYLCESADPGATLSYRWLDPDCKEIPGATGSSLTLDNITVKQNGNYLVQADAVSPIGQTGYSTHTFQVVVLPASGVIAD